MLTKAQWNAMTPQQQWDYCHALEDMIDAMELEGESASDDEDTRELEVVEWWETPTEINWNGVG